MNNCSAFSVIFWRCPYLKYAYKRTGPYCMLGRPEFGECYKCEIYRKMKEVLDYGL